MMSDAAMEALAAVSEQSPPALQHVEFDWSTEHGACYNCGLPAAYTVNGDTDPETNKRCCVCAALDAADGEQITYLFAEDHRPSPYVPGEYAEGDGSSCAVCGEPVAFLLGTWEHERGSDDESTPEPESGDYAVNMGTGYVGRVERAGKGFDVGPDDDTDTLIAAQMEREQFWPNVWYVSDHGNWHIHTLGE